MDSKAYLVLAVFIIACYYMVVVNTQEKSNCYAGAICDLCPKGYYANIKLNSTSSLKVCCLGCRSKYMRYSSYPNPTCTCDFDRVVNEPTCWKGEQCCTCKNSASINGMPVCCAFCKNNSMSLSGKSCACEGLVL